MHIWSGKYGYVPALLRSRYYTFYNIVHHMKAPYKGRLASIKWRNRGADKWCDMNLQENPPQYENTEKRNNNLEKYDEDAIKTTGVVIEQLTHLYSENSKKISTDT